MYEAFYSLTENPFNITPDPKFLYFSEGHEEGLAHLLYGVQRKRGLIVLTGEIGTGKTTLLHTLIERLDAKTHIAFLPNPQVSIIDIYKFAFHEFGLEAKERTKGDFLIELKSFLISHAKAKENVVLILDEAQHLAPDVLEGLRLLTNFETAKEKLIQIILVGQPALDANLNLPGLVQLKQRVGISCRLLPLNYLETKSYIESRLAIAGVKDSPFGSEAIPEIYTYSKGIPRLINNVCDLALFLGFSERQGIIRRSIIRQAAEHLGLNKSEKQPVPNVRGSGGEDRADAHVIKQARGTPMRDFSRVTKSLGNSKPLRPGLTRGSSRRARVITTTIAVICLVVGGIAAQQREKTWATLTKIPWALGHLFTARQSPLQEIKPPLTESIRKPQPRTEKSLPTDTVTVQTPRTLAPVIVPDETTRLQERVNQIVNRERASRALQEKLSLENLQRNIIPYENREGTFRENAEPSHIEQRHPIPNVSIVQVGDSLSKILVKTYGYYDETLLSLVKEANPDMIDSSYLGVGQRIVLPPLPQKLHITPDTLRRQKQ